MNMDIAAASKQFRASLSVEDWFSRLGSSADPHTESLFHPFRVEFITDRAQVSKLMKADSWANVDLDNFNTMLALIDREPSIANKDVINDLAAEGHCLLRGAKAQVVSQLADNGLKRDVFDYVVTPIVVRAFQEFYLSRYIDAVRLDFASNLLTILNIGYLPCGWRSLRAGSANLYNPLAFIEDSFLEAADERIQSFDYTSGKLHVL